MRSRPSGPWALVASLLVLSAPGLLSAQDTVPAKPPTIVRGVVRGPMDQPMPGAPVNIVGTDHGVAADEDGEFTFVGLPEGTTIIEALTLGYSPRRVPIIVSDTTPYVILRLDRMAPMLDSVKIVASRNANNSTTERMVDRVSEKELSEPRVVGSNMLDALELLRPQLFVSAPPKSMSTKGGSTRGQIYSRDATVDWRLKADFSVSVNEGLPQAIDVLTTIPARTVREIRYLRPLDAQARFGVSANGPVLIVYTNTPPSSP